jgi:C2 domain of PTEN tumour-suppressor protein
MWSTWGESAKASLQQALEKTGDALDKAGESLTKAAVSAGKTARDHHGDAGSTAAAAAAADDASASAAATMAVPNKQQELLKNLEKGWTSVVQTTRQSIVKAQEAVEETQHKMQERMRQARTSLAKRDMALPLDVPALKDAQVVYVTDRLISMGHPALDSSSTTNGKIITGERKLAAVGHLLQRRHDGRYMVWNISEVDYDVSILDEQVLTYSFPGSPSPPLGLLLKLLVSIESWLKADARNVAVVHCLTGKGRTSTVLAAFLCWMGEASFDNNIYAALDYIAQCKQLSTDDLVIPSQKRYVSYFKNMLDGVRPSQPPLKLKRVIMSQAPNYTRRSPASLLVPGVDTVLTPTAGSDGEKKDGTTSTAPPTTASSKPVVVVVDEAQLLGCVPYMQIFKAGKLVHTAPASLHFQQSPNDLPFCCLADGSISFHIDQIVQGDVLIRCRHLTAKKQRVSMFRAAFHTGYVPRTNVMRITKSQLDGACCDDRFADDFYLDVIFETVDAEEASMVMEQNKGNAATADDNDPDHHHHHAHHDVPSTSTTTVTASAYDTMLDRDSRFWDVIAKRKELHEKQREQAVEKTDPFWGPTVGRRREFNKKPQGGSSSSNSNNKTGTATTASSAASSAVGGDGKPAAAAGGGGLETFSIGNEFDFLPSTDDDPSKGAAAAAAPSASKKASSNNKPKKKDTLMEALMGALNDDDEKMNETEAVRVVFIGLCCIF